MDKKVVVGEDQVSEVVAGDGGVVVGRVGLGGRGGRGVDIDVTGTDSGDGISDGNGVVG